MEFAPPFGAWQKERRRQLDLTQEELARKAHYSTVAIHRVETGGLRPSREMAEALAGALDIPAADRLVFVSFARGGSARQRADNLPLPLTPLVGREGDVAELRARLSQPGTRLITLLGPPGVGKTRLAIAAATEVLEDYADGACFIALAALDSPGQVADAIFGRLSEFLDARITDWGTAKRQLLDRRLLLVLDNFEHVLEAAPAVTTLLAAAPGLRALVTSRAVLNVTGERLYEVNPLALPDEERVRSQEQALRSPAVALFVQRAQAARSSFALTAINVASVVAVCRKLDGVPLALELAAARIRMFTPETLLEKLEAHLGLTLLMGGPRDLPARQRALRNALAWSFGLLNADEQRLFTRLGVFPGSFTPEAAVEICGEGVQQPLEVLGSLLDRSLIEEAHDVPDQARLTMLVFAREFASERLEASDEAEEIHLQHAEFYERDSRRITPYDPRLDANKPIAWKIVDFHNYRAAILWCACRPAAYLNGLRLLGRVTHLARTAPYHPWLQIEIDDTRAMLEGVFEALGVLPLEEQVVVLTNVLSKLRPTRSSLAIRAEEIILVHGSPVAQGRVLSDRAFEAEKAGCLDAALAHHRMSLDIAERSGNAVMIAAKTLSLGYKLCWYGDAREGLTLLERALALWQALGIDDYTEGGIYTAMEMLASVCARLGHADRALGLAEEAMPHLVELGDMSGEAFAHVVVADAHLLLGNPRVSAERSRAAIRILRDARPTDRSLELTIPALATYARAEQKLDALERAARVFGAVCSRFGGTISENAMPPPYKLKAYALNDALTWIVSHPEFLPHWKEGERMTYAQAIEYALEEHV